MKLVQLTFEPPSSREFTSVLRIGVGGDELYTVPVSGVGGEALQVTPTKLDFGLVSRGSTPDPARLIITNNDKSREMRVMFDSTIPCLNLASIVLPPGSKKRIDVPMTAQCDGPFECTMTVGAPNCRPVTVMVKAFFGPLLRHLE